MCGDRSGKFVQYVDIGGLKGLKFIVKNIKTISKTVHERLQLNSTG